MFRLKSQQDLSFEEAISDDWSSDFEVAETPLSPRSLFYLWLSVFILGVIIAGRFTYLNFFKGSFYALRSEANSANLEKISAPRGIIVDRNGQVLAENKPVFLALLKVGEFTRNEDIQASTLQAISEILELDTLDILSQIKSGNDAVLGDSIVLSPDLTQDQLVRLKALNSKAIQITSGFQRFYPDRQIFSMILGYTGVVDGRDLDNYPELTGQDFIGKAGVELVYERELRGTPGSFIRVKDAKGKVLEEKGSDEPKIGRTLKLTIDADLQRYFHKRMESGLNELGRKIGVGIAINPKSGEVLAMVNFPGFDGNIFTGSGHTKAIKEVLSSPLKPMFNRAISGFYAPGSTIKPLVAVAALEEGVITPQKYIFSPGFLDVPNPYSPDQPTRFLDWRYQGDVNLASAIAQSSNVYFYTVGGGSPVPGGMKGLGVARLRDWWQKFNLGSLTGIDLPGEVKGFLPSIEDKEKKTGKPWLLGDTYNVSIGQGDLLVTPIQLLSYIGAIANGGKVLKPFLVAESKFPEVVKNVSFALNSIKEVQKGMIAAVNSKLGSIYTMSDLPFQVAGKTGSAQVKNNVEVNAFFVGYAPASALVTPDKPALEPQIAILVLVENSRQGSLNAIPIAKDVFNWYHENRFKKQ
ncbi:MAG: penicillin-binding protein 2 [Parcubacteria group bacterium Gr01-1014_20]|nr:MAG: penicillin-binding protein 2 [Parcubacteria group bacterium Gr01-1014_20]